MINYYEVAVITQISAIRILIQVLKNVRFCISLQMFLELWLNFFLGTAFRKKHFAKTPMLKLFFHHSNCRTYFLQKIVCQLLWSPLLCTNLLVQDVNPVKLGKPNAIYQQKSRNTCKLIQNLTFVNTWMKILIAQIYVMTAAS